MKDMEPVKAKLLQAEAVLENLDLGALEAEQADALVALTLSLVKSAREAIWGRQKGGF